MHHYTIHLFILFHHAVIKGKMSTSSAIALLDSDDAACVGIETTLIECPRYSKLQEEPNNCNKKTTVRCTGMLVLLMFLNFKILNFIKHLINVNA